MSPKITNFLADNELNKTQLLALINLAIDIKNNPENYNQALAGKSVAMIFEKPSLRTHVSFDMGINKLGGHALYLGQQNGKLGERERVSDYAKNLSCFSDAIVARVFSHDSIQGLAKHASVPVINALCDLYHPCQALADFVTGLGLTPMQTMLMLIAILIIIGCFMETLSMLLTTAPLITPIVVAMGFDPVWFGILLMVLLETALITPPIGINLYVVQGVRERGELTDVMIGAAPFVVTMFAMLGMLLIFPEIALWLPSLVY